VSRAIHDNPSLAKELVATKNMVAVITNGTAVLGLGDIGPDASLPVMEGKAILFKELGGIDSFPIAVATKDVDEFVSTVKNIAGTFGGINLEDIAAPACFEIERRLQEELSIPVFHDDQHGTAIVLLAGLINALKVVGKTKEEIRVVITGAGAAGISIAKFVHLWGVKNILVCDSKGIISRDRADLNEYKKELLEFTNLDNLSGDLHMAIYDTDVFIGVSGPNILTADDVGAMGKKAIIFAMANPTPEIMPEEAKKGGAYVIATGRSDYPNQLNNALAFPGIFKGALANNVAKITDNMQLAAAQALADLVPNPTPDKIIPSLFEKGVVDAVAAAIKHV
jgi:malate dehydrogenase (oxaloacetate-decarboxylating)